MSTENDSSNPLPQPADTDWFLQSLVNMVNNSTLEIGITLQVSGMLVSGSLVSGKSYFEGFASDFASPFTDPEIAASIKDPEIAASIKESFASYGEVYKTAADDTARRPLPQFIHIKGARFFNTSGNPIPGNMGVWWRGRICEVGGFSLGSLKAEEV
jgi:hypothetical protein